MHEASLREPGGMVAVIGLDPEILSSICHETDTFMARQSFQHARIERLDLFQRSSHLSSRTENQAQITRSHDDDIGQVVALNIIGR